MTFSSMITENARVSPLFLTQKNLIQITNDTIEKYHIKWSPDGKHIAFMSERDGARNIWMIPASGGMPVQLTEECRNSWPYF